ncbi:MAG: TIGR02266 family protein [Myxococcota bacterium]|nr:TIGR02266 family protein [Myxococcota bacterium]
MAPPTEDDPRRSERRVCARQVVPAITLRVQYRRMNTFFADYAKNISKGGTFVETSKPLEVGTELVFVLSVPGHNDPLELRGEVTRLVLQEHATEEQPAGMGLRFRFTNDGERARLDALVEALMAEKLGGRVAARLLGKR